jgi:DNA-binding HxlR family transcriptional regulator
MEQELLALIAEHDGQWGWYQLDRALSVRGIDVSGLMAALDALERARLVAVSLAKPGQQPHYRLTTKGRRLRGKGPVQNAVAAARAHS